MGPAIEAELKFSAESGRPLDLLARLSELGPAALGAVQPAIETDVYLDTPDGRLAAARWACRYRVRGAERRISLKGPAEHRAGEALHRRPELEGPAGDGLLPRLWPPSPARDWVVELAGGAPLEERLTLRQERRERAVLVVDRQVGTLSLDRVEVRRRDRSAGGFDVVELELAGEQPPALVEGLEAALSGLPGLSPEPLSKLELALALLAAPTRPVP